jgi:hypothetical protein
MKELFQIFSNREVALFLWIIIILGFLFSRKEVLKSFGHVIKAFFAKKIISFVILLLLYSFSLVLIFDKVNLWDNIFIKDFIFWFVTVAMVLFFKMNDVKENVFFKSIIFESVKLTMFLEFIVNFYNFSFLTEVILTPIILMIGTMQSYAEVFAYKYSDYVRTGKVLKNLLSLIGFVFISYSIYMSFIKYSQLLTLTNYKSLILPPIFTLWILPLLYVFALAINYESLFIRIRFITPDITIQKELKKQILLTANLNLNRLIQISSNINRQAVTPDIKSYVKRLSI